MNADEFSGRNNGGASIEAKTRSSVASLIRRFVEWREDRRSLREHRRALASFDANDELGVLLRETGITPEQIQNFEILAVRLSGASGTNDGAPRRAGAGPGPDPGRRAPELLLLVSGVGGDVAAT